MGCTASDVATIPENTNSKQIFKFLKLVLQVFDINTPSDVARLDDKGEHAMGILRFFCYSNFHLNRHFLDGLKDKPYLKILVKQTEDPTRKCTDPDDPLLGTQHVRFKTNEPPHGSHEISVEQRLCMLVDFPVSRRRRQA